ncbi:UDP-N-acetylglucosamine 2-epimerase [Nocardioides sp. T5]|uniref:UDP-N-acetylglucosamine 2-epimerase n=1 Tax=Nocardioides sp. T5 TaxID=3400182 RepID=UPI003A842FB5
MDYNKAQKQSYCVLSDSGTISEESSLLDFPAVTLRDSIERPEALDSASILMTGLDVANVVEAVRFAVSDTDRASRVPEDYRIGGCSRRAVGFILSTHARYESLAGDPCRRGRPVMGTDRDLRRGAATPMVDSDEAVQHGRWALYWFAVAVVCVLGPYIVSGLRTEQLAIYGSAAVAALLHLRHLGALRPGWAVLGLWAAYAFVAGVGGFLIESRLEWGSGSLVAGLDNALLPLATMTAVALWMRLVAPAVLLRTASWLVAVGMALNGAIALLTAIVGVDHLPLLRGFWAARGGGVTVAEPAPGRAASPASSTSRPRQAWPTASLRSAWSISCVPRPSSLARSGCPSGC